MENENNTPEQPATSQEQPAAAAANTDRKKRWIISAALVAAGLLGGAVLAGSLTAAAQTPTPSASANSDAGSEADKAGKGRARPDETELTGEAAEKTRAAALEAVPGGTLVRVETDSDGAPYEAHVRKADGTKVTVKLDGDFKVTAVEEGRGRGGPGHRGPRGDEDGDTTAESTSA